MSDSLKLRVSKHCSPSTRRWRRFTAAGLVILLGAFHPSTAGAQSLRVSVIEGDNVTVGPAATSRVVVEVRDANDAPVSGADVTFVSIESGAGEVSFGPSKRQTVKTDPQGRAASAAMVPGGPAGPFTVGVLAAFEGQTASISVKGTSLASAAPVAPAKKGGKLKWFLIAGAGAAAALAAVLLAGRDNDTTPSGPVGEITIGPPTVGQP